MRGDEIVVAAELTGRLSQRCFFCLSKHRVRQAIRRCAYRFVEDMFGRQSIGASSVPSLNWLDMARRGELKRAAEYEVHSDVSYKSQYWEPDWKDYLRFESVEEAYEFTKGALAVWRDEAFKTYNAAMTARNTCLTKYADLIRPDREAIFNCRELSVKKKRHASSKMLESVEIEGRNIHLFEIQAFYLTYWPSAKFVGNLLDVDINADTLLIQPFSHNYGAGGHYSSKKVLRSLLKDGSFKDKATTASQIV